MRGAREEVDELVRDLVDPDVVALEVAFADEPVMTSDVEPSKPPDAVEACFLLLQVERSGLALLVQLIGKSSDDGDVCTTREW